MKNDVNLAADINLLKVLIVSGLKYELLETKAWGEFSEGLNYPVPSEDYLLREIQPLAHQKYLEEISSNNYIFTITILCISHSQIFL